MTHFVALVDTFSDTTDGFGLNAGSSLYVGANATVASTAANHYGVYAAGGSNTVDVAGGVFGPIGIGFISATNTLHVLQGGSVTGDSAAVAFSAGNAIVENDGDITANTDAISCGAIDQIQLTNGSTGSIFGGQYGLKAEGTNSTVANMGDISANYVAVFNTGDHFRLTNTGTITAHEDDGIFSSGAGTDIVNYGLIQTLGDGAFTHGIELNDNDTSAAVKVTNYGTISSASGVAIQGDPDDVDKIWNFGIVNGDIEQGGSKDLFRNGGTINGDVDLGRGDDLFRGWDGTVDGTIHGRGGNDTIAGGLSDDRILGDAGNDVLKGGQGDDILTGGAGRDVLRGGLGADTFDFNTLADSTANAQRDHIVGFERGIDVIDLSGIDAKAGVAGNQAFHFITGAFTGAKGELHAVASGGNSYVSGDVDGDSHADFSILVENVTGLTAGDFVL